MTKRSDIPRKYILAIDHGTSGCKTAVVSAGGEILGFEFEPVPTHRLEDGGVEQDPDDWWQALVTTARRLVQRKLVAVDDIVAVCCSSTFSSTVAADRTGRHLMNSMTWLDARGAPHVQRLMGGLLNVQGYSVANILRWLPRTGGAPTLSGKDSIAHMLYVLNERPEVYREADYFLESKDFLNLKLTGIPAASFDSATLFWVTDTRDIHRVRYDDGLIRKLGIHREKLPPLMRSTDVLGPLKAEVADQIGLSRRTQVVVGSPDLQSACVGSGAVRDFEGHIYIGTSSWVLCHVPFKKTDMFHIIASLPSAIPGRYFCANEQDTAGGCLDFLLNNVLFHKNRLCSAGPPQNAYAELDAIAEAVPAGSHRLIFTPWLNGEKTPVDSETLRGALFNLSLNTTTDHIIRAVYEGVAYNTRWVLKYVERFIRRTMNPLNIIGGGARSDVWCQIFADVLDRRIRRVKDPIQSNARGAGFIAAVALGYIRFEDIEDLIRYDRTFEPDPSNRAVYDELFAEFLNLYRCHRSICRRLNRRRSG